MSRPEQLYRLQQIDSKLDDYQARLEEIEAELADEEAVQAARAEVKAAEQDLQQAKKALRLAEQEVQDQEYKIKKSQDRLYSGKVTNPKELEDIQQEVGALKRYAETLEEQLLEAMLATDEAQEVYDQAQDQLAQARAERDQRHAALREEKQKLEKNVAKEQKRRKRRVADIKPADLETYETLRKRRGGVAVVMVKNRGCSACGATLGTATYQAARSPSQLTNCDTCGRLLFTG